MCSLVWHSSDCGQGLGASKASDRKRGRDLWRARIHHFLVNRRDQHDEGQGLAATATDRVFATQLATQGLTGPSGTLEWLASKMKPAKEGFAVDLDLARYRLPRVAFKRFRV